MWPGSVVVIDPKGENAMVTARRRGGGSQYCDGLGQIVRVLDPFGVTRLPDNEKASFNPLDALDPVSEEAIDEAARIADALIVSEKSSDPFFDKVRAGICKVRDAACPNLGGLRAARAQSHNLPGSYHGGRCKGGEACRAQLAQKPAIRLRAAVRCHEA